MEKLYRALIFAFVGVMVSVAPSIAQYSAKITPDKDCSCLSLEPNTNYGTNSVLTIQSGVSQSDQSVSLLHFDLSSIPQNATITSAYLDLYCISTSGSVALRIGPLDGPPTSPSWSETTVTWNNMPYSTGPFKYDAILATKYSGYDVTEFVQAWYAGTYVNYGFQLWDSTSGSSAVFYAREDGANYAPYLLVSWNALPPVPSLTGEPPMGSVNAPVNPVLSWNPSNGASSYRLQVATSITFSSSSIVFDNSAITATSQQVAGLLNLTTYYWRVNATNSTGTSAWSTTWDFTTIIAAPVPPILISPGNGTTGITVSPIFAWNASSSAASYRLQVAYDFTFSLPVFDKSGITATSQQVTNLDSGDTYYWRVNATNTGGTSPYSDIWSFTTSSPVVAVRQIESAIPTTYSLSQNYPNPFNPSTTIRFDLKDNSTVELDISNILGQKVQEFDLGQMSAGTYSQTVDISRYASGLYFYRIEAMASDGERFISMKKMVLIK